MTTLVVDGLEKWLKKSEFEVKNAQSHFAWPTCDRVQSSSIEISKCAQLIIEKLINISECRWNQEQYFSEKTRSQDKKTSESGLPGSPEAMFFSFLFSLPFFFIQKNRTWSLFKTKYETQSHKGLFNMYKSLVICFSCQGKTAKTPFS